MRFTNSHRQFKYLSTCNPLSRVYVNTLVNLYYFGSAVYLLPQYFYLCVLYSYVPVLVYLTPVLPLYFLAIMHFRCILKTWVLLLRHCIFIHMCLTIITFVGVIGTIYLLILFMQHIYICMQLSTISGIFMPFACIYRHMCSIMPYNH